MARVDDRILEHIHDRGFGGSGTISESPYIDVGQSYLSKRISALVDLELIHKVGHGIYQLTVKGRHYLAGGYDAAAGEYLDEISYSHWPCANWKEVGELADEVAEVENEDWI